MSAEVKDDETVDRETVISNLIMLRMEEFLEQPSTENTRHALTASLVRSLLTMKMVFQIQKKVPIVQVERNGDRSFNVFLIDPETNEPQTVGDWLTK